MIVKNKNIVFITLILLVSFAVHAKTPPPPISNFSPPPGLPIDGGVLWVGLIGLAYGTTKLLLKKKD